MNEIDRIKAMSPDELKAHSAKLEKEFAGYIITVVATKVAILMLTRALMRRYWGV